MTAVLLAKKCTGSDLDGKCGREKHCLLKSRHVSAIQIRHNLSNPRAICPKMRNLSRCWGFAAGKADKNRAVKRSFGGFWDRIRQLSLLLPEIPESLALSPQADFCAANLLVKVMTMIDPCLHIKSEKDGQTTLIFKTDAREIIPPQTHEERMEWVRSSFSRFYSRVQESDFAVQSGVHAVLTSF